MSAGVVFLLLVLFLMGAMTAAVVWLQRHLSEGLGRDERPGLGLEAGWDDAARERIARRRAAVHRGVAEPAPRHLSNEDAEEAREAFLLLLADAGGLAATAGKGESLIRGDGPLPASTMTTQDQGRDLICELRGRGPSFALALRLELNQPSNVHMRLRPEDALTEEQRARGREHEIGHAEFDDAFFIESRGWAGVEPLVQHEEARAAVTRVFQIPGVTSLTVLRGRIRVDGEIHAGTSKEELEEMLGALRLLARIYEGEPPISLTLDARPAEAASRCPFCRDTLDDAPDIEVAACEGCGTRQHVECNEENGGCPVLGCGRSGRGRVRDAAARLE